MVVEKALPIRYRKPTYRRLCPSKTLGQKKDGLQGYHLVKHKESNIFFYLKKEVQMDELALMALLPLPYVFRFPAQSHREDKMMESTYWVS